MLSRIESSSVNSKVNTPHKLNAQKVHPNFKGLGEFVLKGIQLCEAQPMVNVTVLDLSTAIIPRTIFETFIGSKQKDENGEKKQRKLNLFGGFEAFRRESSGLIINCIIPSFIVSGVAALLNKPIMKNFSKAGLAGSWANSEAIDKIEKYYNASKGTNVEERMYNTLKSMFDDIEGVDGDVSKGGLKKFKDIFANSKEYEQNLREMAKNIVSKAPNKDYKKNIYDFLVKKSGIAENIRFVGESKYSTSNLSHICNSAGEILHGIAKTEIADDAQKVAQYFKKANRLVNIKSVIGLGGIIIPLAIAAQPVNRWITHRLSGQKGAPIYNDNNNRELTPDEKKKLTAEKFFAVPLMWAVAGLSMLMDRPSWKMFQFKNIFPTMDQARIISAATFSSRIAASEDSNELKENTIRDIATFSSFYFLGDYAAKGIASFIEKHNKDGIKLINRLKKVDDNANVIQRFWNWAKHTSMKSSDELGAITDEALRSKAKNLRALCHAGNIAFSLISLGIFIPLYTRTQTNKKRQMELERLALANASTASFTSRFSQSDAFSSFSLEKNQKAS